jgi:glycerol dehydrogenase
MPIDAPYQPAAVFGDGDSTDRQPPHALIGPARYVQGPDVWLGLARYLSLVPTTRPAVIISSGGRRRQWPGIEEHLSASGVEAVPVEFRGECSSEEADRLATALRAISPSVDAVVAVGGGKCIDTGKCVAHRLDLPVVICPSLASNDAPCSALSVMYSADGIFAGVEFFPKSPALVAVDTRVVAEAPVRYLVAGMGDAMATWSTADAGRRCALTVVRRHATGRWHRGRRGRQGTKGH